ncbi:MAG: DUF427 domain-containing protein [Polyangiales bacterium]
MTSTPDQDEIEHARTQWAHRGKQRPPWAVEPGPGQESVWDYPRPPRLAPDARLVRVAHGGIDVAESRHAVRVLETASPPTFYLPEQDVDTDLLVPGGGSSHCEWKGRASYWSLKSRDGLVEIVAWSYEEPYPAFDAIRGYFSFYPRKVECYVDSQRVRPQPGGFYGGWITDEIVGPFKGDPNTGGW